MSMPEQTPGQDNRKILGVILASGSAASVWGALANYDEANKRFIQAKATDIHSSVGVAHHDELISQGNGYVQAEVGLIIAAAVMASFAGALLGTRKNRRK